MRNSNEQKPNIVHRLISSTLKFKKEHLDNQSKSSFGKFKYELPESFLKAVDKARITAGYDILPRLRPRSASPSIEKRTCSSSSTSSPVRSDNRDQTKPKISHSSSTNDLDRVLTRKIPFRRTPRRQIPHQHHETTTPRFFAPRPRFRIMMNPNFMMIHRSPRPTNILPMPIHQRPAVFRLRFR